MPAPGGARSAVFITSRKTTSSGVRRFFNASARFNNLSVPNPTYEDQHGRASGSRYLNQLINTVHTSLTNVTSSSVGFASFLNDTPSGPPNVCCFSILIHQCGADRVWDVRDFVGTAMTFAIHSACGGRFWVFGRVHVVVPARSLLQCMILPATRPTTHRL